MRNNVVIWRRIRYSQRQRGLHKQEGRVGRSFLSDLIQRRCEQSQADSVHQTSVVNRSRHRAFACSISYRAYSTNRQTETEEERHTQRRKQTDEQIGPSLKRYWACGACRCMEIRRTNGRTDGHCWSEWAIQADQGWPAQSPRVRLTCIRVRSTTKAVYQSVKSMHYRSGGGGGTVTKKRRAVADDYLVTRHSRSISSSDALWPLTHQR